MTIISGSLSLKNNRADAPDKLYADSHQLRRRVVFDGVIYNTASLKSKLSLPSATATEEVILALYKKYGMDGFDMLEGAFALAVRNDDTGELVLVRDRAGEKPLYYTMTDGSFSFSSDLKDLANSDGVSKRINQEAMCQYFQLGYIFAPLTIYENIFSLEPGFCLIVEPDGRIEKYEYFDLDCSTETNIADYGECRRLLRETLISSVEQRIDDTDPIGVFLSGGIDSTIITGIASTILDRKISTFTIGFTEKEYDESDRALIAATAHNTDHHVFTLEFDQALEKLDTIIGSMGQPFADKSAIPTYIVNEYAKKRLDTVLTGDGSDQIFAGSSKYLVNYYADRYNRIPKFIRNGIIRKLVYAVPDKNALTRKLRKVIGSAEMDEYSRRERMMSLVFTGDELDYVLNDASAGGMARVRALYDRYGDTADELTRTLYTDLKVVVEGGMIAKMGSMSRLAGVEARMPMVSGEMLRLAFRIPSEYKLNGKVGKYILRDAFSDVIPDELKAASKKGFDVPLNVWFRGPLKGTLLEMLDRDFIEAQGIFDYSYIQQLIDEHFSGRVNRATPLWALYVFQRWYRVEFGE